MANASEATRQDVEEKAADELAGLKRHHFGLVTGAVVLPAEDDAPFVTVEEPAIGNGDAVGISAEIVEDLLWAAKRPLGVDDPGRMAERLESAGKDRGLAEMDEIAEKLEFTGMEGSFKPFKKAAAVQMREDMNRKKEALTAGDPAPVRSNAATGHEAMEVRVMAPTPTIP